MPIVNKADRSPKTSDWKRNKIKPPINNGNNNNNIHNFAGAAGAVKRCLPISVPPLSTGELRERTNAPNRFRITYSEGGLRVPQVRAGPARFPGKRPTVPVEKSRSKCPRDCGTVGTHLARLAHLACLARLAGPVVDVYCCSTVQQQHGIIAN